MAQTGRDVWIFAYGSLMWRPGFEFAEACHARLVGYHRAFCVYSILYRGSPKRPGLVLGLDRGGVCEGMAFRLDGSSQEQTLAYLRERELVYGVYREAQVEVELLGSSDRESVPAMAFIAERAHPSHSGRLSLGRQAALIRSAQGSAGNNLDYLINTLAHLSDLGIRERSLERLLTLAGAFAANGAGETARGRARSLSLARAWSRRPHAKPLTARDNRFGYRRWIGASREGV